MKSLIYVGNKQLSQKSNPSTIDSLSKQLIREGFQVTTVSAVKNKLIRLFYMWGTILFHASKTDAVLIDTYSTLNFWYAYTCSVLCRILRIPYIPILHGGNLPHRFQTHPNVTRALCRYAHVTVVPSAYLAEHLKFYAIPRMQLIPNTIELAKYPFHQKTITTPKLLWVRAIDSIYNPELALETLVLLRQTHSDAQLTMVGPYKGNSEHEWHETLERYNVPVTMTGSLSKETWIALAKEHTVFINTTTIDNMPVSVMEAMALGLPVVSTNVGGIPYLITDEKSGLLVPSNDAKAMADAIERLVSDPVLTEQIALAARKVVEGFDWEVVKEQWKAVLK